MKSIQDTMKITNAMYMIFLIQTAERQRKVWQIQSRISYALQSAIGAYLTSYSGYRTSIILIGMKRSQEDRKKRGYIVITADKGLAGAYNHNVLKLASEQLEKGEQQQAVCGR